MSKSELYLRAAAPMCRDAGAWVSGCSLAHYSDKQPKSPAAPSPGLGQQSDDINSRGSYAERQHKQRT